MNEYPVFVPCGDERVGATVTMPEGRPRGLVLLMPGGGGAPRSHYFSMWTKAARGLAERDVASIRMDWRGVGDSTGEARFGFRMLPMDDAVEVARFGMRVTGIERLGMAGNCGGARTVLGASAQLPQAESLVLILLKPLAHTRSSKPLVVKSKGLVKRIPAIEPMARRLYWGSKSRRTGPILERIEAVSHQADVLLMESLAGHKAGNLPQLVAGMKRTNGRHRVEIRDLPGGSSRVFHSLERQRLMIEAVVEWFDGSFPGDGERSPAESAGRSPEPLSR